MKNAIDVPGEHSYFLRGFGTIAAGRHSLRVIESRTG
jgi:hypothetical protein